MSKKKNNHLQSKNQQVAEIRTESFSGPLPPPTILEQYERVSPGAAAIIIKKFEQQTDHRIGIEKSVIKAGNFKEILGLIFGFIIAMTTIVGGIYTALKGYPFLGGPLTFTGLAILVGVFFLQNQVRKQE